MIERLGRKDRAARERIQLQRGRVRYLRWTLEKALADARAVSRQRRRRDQPRMLEAEILLAMGRLEDLRDKLDGWMADPIDGGPSGYWGAVGCSSERRRAQARHSTSFLREIPAVTWPTVGEPWCSCSVENCKMRCARWITH